MQKKLKKVKLSKLSKACNQEVIKKKYKKTPPKVRRSEAGRGASKERIQDGEEFQSHGHFSRGRASQDGPVDPGLRQVRHAATLPHGTGNGFLAGN